MGRHRGVLIVALVVFLAATALHLTAQLLAGQALRDWSQALLMPPLALVMWAWYPPGRVRTGVLMALLLSWVGDVLPKVVPDDVSFLTMVGGFLVAQLVYVAVFLPWVAAALRAPAGRRRLLLAAVVYLPLVIILSLFLVPHAAGLAWPVVIYAAVIGAMAISAVAVHPVAAAGAALFVLSDAMIGLNAFWPPYQLPGQGFWVMVTYIGAQVLLVLGIGRRLVIDSPSPAHTKSGTV